MANKLNRFLKLDVSGNKGNLADYQHASRLFTDDTYRLAPKHKFLYHVVFHINPAVSLLPEFLNKYRNEINLLVKTVDLPRYTINVDTKQQYNRKKNYQSRLDYSPITITFHDDNNNVVNKLWESYYRYYYADGNHVEFDGAYNVSMPVASYSQNAYKTPNLNKFNYGLDNGSFAPFFTAIHIFQLSRKEYNGFTLVNPIITAWNHDTMDYSDGGSTVENSCTVAYESVFHSSGLIEEDNPRGFALTHYDKIPSPLTVNGNPQNRIGINEVFNTTTDNRNSAIRNISSVSRSISNLINNVRSLSPEGLRSGNFSLLTNLAENVSDSSGLANTVFPKNRGAGGAASLDNANNRNISSSFNNSNNVSEIRSQLLNDPERLVELTKSTTYRKQYINSTGSSNVNDINSSYDALPQTERSRLENQTLANLANIIRGIF